VPVRIVVDDREGNSKVPSLLRDEGAVLDFAQLKVGDYIVSVETAIERKTIQDLISSIYDGRLFVQCSELNQHYQKPALIVEGNIADLFNVPKEMNKDNLNILGEGINLIYDAMAEIVVDFRIPIVHTLSPKHTAHLLITMAKKSILEGKRSNGPLLKRIKKSNPEYIQQLSILSSLPGIGNKLAARMLEKFETPHRALNASIADLARIPSFGIARAAKVRKVLDYSYNRRATVLQRTLLDDLDNI
jgi:DNA excision repair protein ERCC-4